MTDHAGSAVDPRSAPRQAGMPLTFLVPGGVHQSTGPDASELTVRVRLTSYRSLPLSCLREVRLAIDGVEVPTERLTFVLDGNAHRLDELGDRTDLWWYILDEAELRVALDAPLAAGPHALDGSLTTLIPFATGGRTTATASAGIRFELGER